MVIYLYEGESEPRRRRLRRSPRITRPSNLFRAKAMRMRFKSRALESRYSRSALQMSAAGRDNAQC